MFHTRLDIDIPGKIILGTNRDSFIISDGDAITFFLHGNPQFAITTEGALLHDDAFAPALVSETGHFAIAAYFERPPTEDIQDEQVAIGDGFAITNIPEFAGFLLDNAYKDTPQHDYRLHFPADSTVDAVTFNTFPEPGTAGFNIAKNGGDFEGNVWLRFSLRESIFQQIGIRRGGIINMHGHNAIYDNINHTNIGTTTPDAYTDEEAIDILTMIPVREFVWSNRAEPGGINDYDTEVIEAFVAEDVEAIYPSAVADVAAYTSGEFALEKVVSQSKLFPILWAAVRHMWSLM